MKELLSNGKSWSDMWIEFGQRQYSYDENFMAVSNYAKNNQIGESFTKKLLEEGDILLFQKVQKRKRFCTILKV